MLLLSLLLCCYCHYCKDVTVTSVKLLVITVMLLLSLLLHAYNYCHQTYGQRALVDDKRFFCSSDKLLVAALI